MKLRVGYWIITAATIRWHCTFPCAEELKPTVTPTESHTGLYFEEIGRRIFFYPTQWNVLIYVNIKPTQLLWKQVKAHKLQTVNYCLQIHSATWY